MAASSKIVFALLAILLLCKYVVSEKDFENFFRRRHIQVHHRERRAVTAAQNAKDKETNKLVFTALYGGLGQGIQSSTNFDYANGLDPKIQSAGGYGLPPGIYSYAFDPKTGMPFMCDPTKTPPGGGKSQAAGVAAINPPTARKPTGDEPVANAPAGNEFSASAPSPDIHPSANTNTNKVIAVNPPTSTTEGNNAVPEHRLSPIENTKPSRTVQNYNAIASATKPTQIHVNKKTNPTLGDDIMAPTKKRNNYLVATPVKDRFRPAASSKDIHVKLGSPLLIPAPKTNAQSSKQSKVNNQRITPLIDNYNRKMQHVVRVLKAKRSNLLKKYIQRKDAVKKNEIKIKLPEIPPCPDMKNYHWPWNCLEKGNTVRKDCIQGYGGTFSFEGATYPYEDYAHMYDYNTDDNGNYPVE
ncbi:uncharacterized protein LOC114530998 [Dendronephthya gigantea]|uniref:uncharacterized protein LOC114530998 n=1 Tax=Dendronephthya gigantea TaxID=151771 RepID=UPI0010692D7B|nr:uncharacterized protein LOC114530998 [Dendronephthya gigantea]